MDDDVSDHYESNVAQLGELIKGLKYAMVTTRCGDDSLRSRPLTTLDTDFDGGICFIVQSDSEVCREIESSPTVNVGYANADGGKYVSVMGRGETIRDSVMAAQLWHPAFKVWFSGPDDPNLAILRVVACEADYWDSPSTSVGRFVGFVTALATGDDSALGQHRRLDLRARRNASTPEAAPGGEGNYAASREYNNATQRFVQAGRVPAAAKAAAPVDAAEAADLERAEQVGKSHAKEEDPQLTRSSHPKGE